VHSRTLFTYAWPYGQDAIRHDRGWGWLRMPTTMPGVTWHAQSSDVRCDRPHLWPRQTCAARSLLFLLIEGEGNYIPRSSVDSSRIDPDAAGSDERYPAFSGRNLTGPDTLDNPAAAAGSQDGQIGGR
jgi:hypothetical protein